MKLNFKKTASAFLVFLTINFYTGAQSLKVAVAANLQSVIKVLQQDFNRKTGITIEPVIGSSGNLATQVRNGAPFDVFLSADMGFPKALFKDGLASKFPVVYAKGSLIICSSQNVGFENWPRLLLTTRINKIAIANPIIAPYGKAAEDALKNKGILKEIRSKIVTGESIAQVNTYISTGVTEVGFTTQSFVKDQAGKSKIYWKVIDPKLYSPIEQGLVVLKHGEGNKAAEKFYLYLLSPSAKSIFREFGYLVQ